MRATCSFLLVALIGVGGCGGGGDDTTTTPVTLAFTEPAAGATLSRDVLEPGAGWIAAPLAAQLAVTGEVATIELTDRRRRAGRRPTPPARSTPT
jgi:hypothetical protein